jgi:uncharacterized protein
MARPVAEEAKITLRAKSTRRTFLKRTTLAAGAAALGLAGYSGLIEPNEVDVQKIELRIQGLSEAFDGFKIALLSDLHFGPYTGAREIGAAVRAANELKPDVVAVLGDFVSEPTVGDSAAGAKKAEPCAKVLSGLRSRLGTFAVLGNHDYVTDPEFVADALQSHGIPLLRNASHPVEQNGGRLWFLGVNDVVFRAAQLDRALAGVPAGETKILLVHEPDFADYSSRYGIAVQLSGHSHGGQVRIPGVHPLFLPELARKYYEGYYRVGELQLYTNRGIGTIGLPFRLLCPPEVTLVTLRPA